MSAVTSTKLVVVGLTALSATAAQAQNFQSVPLGGRSGAMGGAGAAFGRDAATPMMNPANLVLLDKSTLSLSANVYGRSIATSEKYFRLDPGVDATFGNPEKARLALTSDVFDIFPSSLGYYKFFPDEDHPMVVALSFFNAQHTHYAFSGAPQIVFPDGAFRTTGRALYERDAYYLGPTYALGLGSSFRLGVSLFTIHQPMTSVRQSKALRTAANNTTFFAEEFEEFLDGSSTDLQGILGASFSADDFSVGLSVSTPTIHLTGAFEDEIRRNTTKPGGVEAQPSLIGIETFDGDLVLRQPMRLTLGGGYERKGSFAVAIDGNVYLASNDAIELSGDRRIDEIKQFGVSSSISRPGKESKDYAMVVDVNAGAEVNINDTSAVRFGVFYDRSTVEFPSTLTDFNQFDVKEDRIGGTLGYGINVGAFQSDFGVLGYLGSGEIVSKELFGERTFKAPLDTYGVLFFVAGSMDAESTRKKFADKMAPGAGAAADAAADPGALVDFGTVRPLALGDLDPGLSQYAGRADFDALSAQPIEVRRIDHPKYDRFFEKGARLRGSVATTRLILDKARRDLEGETAPGESAAGVEGSVAAADALAANPENLTPARRHTLGETRRALGLATNALKGLAGEATAIVADGQRLVQTAPDDFKGPLAAKVPAIVSELTTLVAALGEAVAAAPGLAADAGALVGAMARIPDLESPMPTLPGRSGLPGVPALPARPGVPATSEVGRVPDAPAVPPVVAPTGAAADDEGKPCFVAGRASVKFRVSASHKAKPTGLVPAGAEMRCFELEAGWRRVTTADGSVTGYLPESYVRWPSP